jgi:phosphoribosyl 1,2-cyclic phosphodiesterase
VDAGSGIRALGAALGPCKATLLLSHYHWDHIQGMPFFGSAFCPESCIRVLGPKSEGRGPDELLAGQMAQPYFPAPPSQLVGVQEFGTVEPGEPFRIGSATVQAGLSSHPGKTFGYRIDDNGSTFVYLSDDEVATASRELFSGMAELAAGADALLHDCQYTESEYATRRGWGHSTPRQAVRLASAAGVRRLVLFHHDPSHSDEQVEALADEVRKMAGGIEVSIAQEGAVMALTGGRTEPALLEA